MLPCKIEMSKEFRALLIDAVERGQLNNATHGFLARVIAETGRQDLYRARPDCVPIDCVLVFNVPAHNSRRTGVAPGEGPK